MSEILALGLFASTILVVLLGFPIAFSLAGISLIFAFIGNVLGQFDFSLFTALVSRYSYQMINETFVAVPLFIFMGVMLEKSRIAENLLQTMGQLFGSLRGGLGFSVVIVGALLAASTGIVGATVVTMGLLSLPAMLKAKYDPKLATGIICASGTLGQIIPPSTVLIFMADFIQTANSTAQANKGNLTPEPVSVGDLFVGAIIPGFLLVAFYMLWVLYKSVFHPDSAPALIVTKEERKNLPRQVIKAIIPPLLLIIAVLGSIIMGFATPTESASVGAIGAVLLAILKRQFSWSMLRQTTRQTLKISSMVFVILLGASVFSLVFRGLQGEVIVEDFLSALPGGKYGAIFAVMLLMFLLGFFLDTFEIIFIVVPITAPILLAFDGVSPVWLGVIMAVNLQTSFLTPPFGFSLFYLRGVAPKSVMTSDIYRGIIPFVSLQVIAIIFLVAFPELTTWLPDIVYREEYIAPEFDPSRDIMFPGDELLNDNLIPDF
ncbi:MAG: TRAP transporter large permease subunit [Alphaproteobacteria bacterium]|nr:TRAP transporter large permease subunit [Alphaproteobacteria bacterium]